MKALLFNPFTSYEQIYADWDLSPLDTYSPPLGILYIASFIRENGITPYVVDLQANQWSIEMAVEYALKIKPEVIGISSMTISFSNANRLAIALKKALRDIPIVLGGAHISATSFETMENYHSFDYGVINEGEITFLELIRCLEEERPLSDVNGLIWRDPAGNIYENERRSYISNLDDLPFPAWDLLDGFPEKYPHSILESKRLPAASIMTSRGCPYNCTFCDNTIFGRRVRHFSAEYSIRMIEHLINNYGIKDLMVLDDNFLVDRNKLYAICDGIINKKLDLTWYCMGHAKMMTEDRLRKIRQAGCWFIELGIESGNECILMNINKNASKQEIKKAVATARKYGLKAKGNFIFGFPGETVSTLEESAAFAREIKLDFFQQNFLTIWPGCELYNQVNSNPDTYEHYNSDWSSLAHQRITFIPKGMTKSELVNSSKKAFRNFYLRPGIIIGLIPFIFSRRGIKFLFSAFITFIRTIKR